MTKLKSESEGSRFWLVVVVLVVVFVGVVATFSLFMQQTNNRVIAQNSQYVSDVTVHTEKFVSSIMTNALKDANTIAALASESQTTTEEVTSEEWLASIADLAPFDTIDFVDTDGLLHSAEAENVDVSDRGYFKDAMAGNSGVEVVFDTRTTHENLVYFYAPVRDGADGPIVGFLLGHYSESRMAELLETSFFGYESQVILCLPTGEVIAASDSSYVGANILDGLGLLQNNASRNLSEVFANGENTTFTYEGISGTGSACVRSMPDFDWLLIETFPSTASQNMITAANDDGWHALAIIVVIFAVVLMGIMAYEGYQRRAMAQEVSDKLDVQLGLARLTDHIALIDVQDKAYKQINKEFRQLEKPEFEGDPIPCQGSYDTLKARIKNMIVDENVKEGIDESLSLKHLEEELPEGVDSVRFEFNVIRNNILKWEDFTFLCVNRDDEGKPRRLVLATQDVSNLKQREKELQQAMEDSYRAAIAANNAKSDFLSRMSHDIRTPMNAIVGMTELARMSEGDAAKVDDCLNKITISSNHLLSLINEVLDLSMIENGRLMLNMEEVDLRDIMLEIETVFAQRCEEGDLSLTVESVDLVHPIVECDKLRLQQIFMNMLGNAVKFTPAGGSVSVRVIEHPSHIEDSCDYELVFADTGCGMSPEFVEHVFEPFTREHDSRTEHVEGTGLGLSIVSNVVSLMGGTIEVDSALGRGTTFTVHVTMHYFGEDASAAGGGSLPSASAAEDGAHADEPAHYVGSRVLLVEDNELNREIVCALLDSLDVVAETAVNGQDAIDTLVASEPNHFDLVLMDIQMPVMNGLDATRHIRTLDREDLRRIPIVVLSANAFTEDVQESKRAGADLHLSKPVGVKDLDAVLRDMLG